MPFVDVTFSLTTFSLTLTLRVSGCRFLRAGLKGGGIPNSYAQQDFGFLTAPAFEDG
jgi:hypothetical protein